MLWHGSVGGFQEDFSKPVVAKDGSGETPRSAWVFSSGDAVAMGVGALSCQAKVTLAFFSWVWRVAEFRSTVRRSRSTAASMERSSSSSPSGVLNSPRRLNRFGISQSPQDATKGWVLSHTPSTWSRWTPPGSPGFALPFWTPSHDPKFRRRPGARRPQLHCPCSCGFPARPPPPRADAPAAAAWAWAWPAPCCSAPAAAATARTP